MSRRGDERAKRAACAFPLPLENLRARLARRLARARRVAESAVVRAVGLINTAVDATIFFLCSAS